MKHLKSLALKQELGQEGSSGHFGKEKGKIHLQQVSTNRVLDRAAHFKQAEDKKKWDRNYVTYYD